MSGNNEKREVSISLPLLILIIGIIVGIAIALIKILAFSNGEQQQNNENNNILPELSVSGSNISGNNEITQDIQEENNDNESEENIVSDFDLSFLKLENQKENKIYSPLSIKYALNMLADGASGEAKEQITNVIGKQNITKYVSNKNMSIGNSLFLRDTFANNVKKGYIDTLKAKYDAEVIFDSFETPENVNSWVSEKTLNLINNILQSIEEDTNYILINALGIDMEWKEKFLKIGGEGWSYPHENYHGYAPEQVSSHEFGKENKLVSGMEIMATINNYDIVEELGEENIIQTVSEEYKKWAKSLTEDDWEYSDTFKGDLSEENIEKKLQYFLYGKEEEDGYKTLGYLEGLDSNYGRINWSTDFTFYVDNEIKAFSKDLKEYDGTTLQYIGIMPVESELDNYVAQLERNKIDNIISNLKELKSENFKEGVITEIVGYIPKFDFEYELKLKEDLEQLGIKNVFEEGKAKLTEITDNENDYINKVMHKANIEFTQDGIKAAAVTMFGGLGAGGSFDYIYEVPVEKIDLTFDKPYMFLIRDKETGEIWFTGTVYEPLLWENEPENINNNI